MFEEYYSLYEKCEKLNNPTYKQLEEIEKEWNKLTIKLFKNFDIKGITEMWTDLDIINDYDYYENFVSSLEYYYDRMNLNRWCRLQLLLGNAMNKAYMLEEK